MTLCAFRIAEDRRVLLPTMVHVDGFYLTHVVEPIEIPEKALVDKFLPPFKYPLPLDADRPVTMGAFAPPVVFSETKKAQEVNLRASRSVIDEAWREFAAVFGREYHAIEHYRTEDADTLLFTLGAFGETASAAVDRLRDAGRKVGLLKLRLWRPFPFPELRQAVKNCKTLIVLDRALSYGGPGGPVYSEIRSALYNEPVRPRILGFIGGLGGRDLTVADFEAMVNRTESMKPQGAEQEFEMYGVRE
jgi:pyruvate ferredoxin oxidoreductase alpha subunit